ncbi:MAG: NAD(P)-dependent oxidoreductase [Chloroflexota bacterium]|nr:MAG: NAD(P)-dependent oxidoreductase [Chloroflexota bacterium]
MLVDNGAVLNGQFPAAKLNDAATKANVGLVKRRPKCHWIAILYLANFAAEARRVELGFIGLGLMGKPMVRHLLTAGHRVHIHNRSRSVVDELAGAGAIPAASPSEVAARAHIVMTCLPNTDQVERVYFGADGLVPAMRAGQLFIDHSTVGLDTTKRCDDGCRARGGTFLDAPVSGGPAGATAATLTIMVGGDAATFERARPIFDVLGKNVRHCGPSGAGSAIKLVNQLLVAINMAGVAEALAFGVKAGASIQTILEVVGTGFGGSRMLERAVPIIQKRDFKPGTAVNLILKDLGLINALAGTIGCRLDMAQRAEEVFQAGRDTGLGDDDMAGLVRQFEKAAGVAVS